MPTVVDQLFDQQIRSLPANDQLRLVELIVQHMSATTEVVTWARRNQRRGQLIYKDVNGSLSPEEQQELESLQREADQHMR